MNNLQTILERFDNTIEHEYDNCAANEEGQYCCLDKEHDRNKIVKDFIKQAYYAGAEEHARLSEVEEKEELTSWDDPTGKEIEYTNGFNNAVYTQKELSQKALEQIKQQQVLNTIKKELI